MLFAIVDSEGATVETSDDREKVLLFLQEQPHQEADDRDDLIVLEYRDGARFGAPVPASDFVRAASNTPLIKLAINAGEAANDAAALRSELTMTSATVTLIRPEHLLTRNRARRSRERPSHPIVVSPQIDRTRRYSHSLPRRAHLV